MTEQRVGADAKLAFAALLFLAAVGALIDSAALGWLLAPICILLGWFAILRAPLKHTMLVLMFFALTLENPSEIPGNGQWATPFVKVGGLLLTHFKTMVGGWMFFGGMDLMLLAAGAVALLRGRSSTTSVRTPRPMIRLAQLTFVTILFTWLVGKWRGGGDASMALWQIDRVMYLPAVFLLCQAAFTQPKDYLAVGKVALAAGVIRALQAIYVRAVVPATIDPQSGESSLPYATTHHDSMLFGMAAVLLVSLVLQRVGRKATRLALLLAPIIVGGMIANERRMVWVQIILVFAALYLMTEKNAFKRKLQRALLFLGPVGIGYVAAGWSAKGGFFKPVQVIRSAVDSSVDGSAAWRDVENFNLVFTMRQFPFVGTGYGFGFWEVWPLPEIPYALERFVPHNSILGLWCYGGYVGYTGITLLWVGGVYFCVRAYYHCKEPLQKAAALVSFGTILIYYVQCFGDMGLGSWTGVFTVAPAIVVGCKLAVASGAWPMAAQASKAARVRFGGASKVAGR